jgi:hypothetical protein
MARLISFPFRVAEYGAVANNEQGSDQYYSEQIATIVLTQQDERPLRPLLGMPDMVFRGFPFSTFQAQVAEELPEIVDVLGKIEYVNDTTEVVVIEYDLVQEYQ